MSMKQSLLFAIGAATFITSAVFAGGPDHYALLPQQQQPSENAIYLEGQLGYAFVDWSDFNSNNVIGNSATANYAVTSNGNGGLSGGADLGYQFAKYFGVEGGWVYLPTVDARGTGNAVNSATVPTTSTTDVSSWALYLAAKIMLPLYDGINLYGKAGAAYRHLSYGALYTTPPNGIVSVNTSGYYFAPLFAVGVGYTISNWLLSVQYMFIASNTDVNNANSNFGAPDAAPAVNLLTGTVGYRFDL